MRMGRGVAVVVMAGVGAGWGQGPVAPGPERAAGKTVRIELIGDSTQTDNAGYGRGFCANLTVEVDCVNMSRGGASTRTYRELGLWDKAIASKPDWMLIQFGHNDMETPEHLDRQVPIAQYEANLRRFVEEARAAGVKPVLVTPLTRRYFGPDGRIHSDLTAHAETMKRVAAEMKAPLIDLQTDSIAYLDRVGEAKGTALGITKKDETGRTVPDKTHLNWAGSYVFGRIVAEDMGRAVPTLARYVKPSVAELPGAGVRAMVVMRGGPVKIVLVGDSTVATGGGWGPGFCAAMTPNVTCVDLALNGRSSKSFVDEGAWKKALEQKGDYYLIQFGHNDQKPDPARHTDAATTFREWLRRYVADARAIGAVPVLVTSLSRRTYRDGRVVEDLRDYAEATKQVGISENVTVIDLNAMSTAMLNKMTQAEADGFDAETHPDARAEAGGASAGSAAVTTATVVKLDRTHLNARGQGVFGRMVADDLIRRQVELGPDVVGEPAKTKGVAAGALAAPTEGK